MTRVNVGIDPRELTTQLLVAELHEMIRIPAAIADGRAVLRGSYPATFRLNAGHVRFFYKRLGYLRRRYHALRLEALRRGVRASNFDMIFEGLPGTLFGEYTPTEADRSILLERFAEKGHELLKTAQRDPTL
jgi:deoxyribonuclease (pyrimidine dimer)